MQSKVAVILALFSVAFAAELSVSINGVEPLGGTFLYEGWLIGGSSGPVSTGFLTVSSNNVGTQDFTVGDDFLTEYTGYLVTIEPDDSDSIPSDTHLIGGDFDSDGDATLTISFPAALGTDFSTATGEFILAAPSSPGSPANLGIWFLNNSNPPPVAGLSLPTLPAGWVYEGWVVFAGVPTSTGTFTDPNAADSDGPGPNAGPTTTGLPNYPGQDFVNPPQNVAMADMTVITVEPSPDDAPTPFAMKPLRNTNIMDVTTVQSMSLNLATNPTGTVLATFGNGYGSYGSYGSFGSFGSFYSFNSYGSFFSFASYGSFGSFSSSSGSSSSSSSGASVVAMSALALGAAGLALF